MPSLVLLGVRTFVSGDDLRIFSVLAVLLRVIQIVLIIPLLALMIRVGKQTKDQECTRYRQEYANSGMAIMYSFLIISFVVAILQSINDILIFRVSSIGTPVETTKRQKLQLLCAIKFGPHAILRVAALVLGILSSNLVHDYCYCLSQRGDDDVTPGQANTNICPNYYAYICFLRGLLVTLCIEVTATALIYFYFVWNYVRPRHWIRMGLRAARSTLRKTKDKNTRNGSIWSLVCRVCCTCTSLLSCCLFGGHEAIMSDFVDISVALEDLFDDEREILDVTVSDILSGLVLLAREQHEHRSELKRKLLDGQDALAIGSRCHENGQEAEDSPTSKRKTIQYIRMSRNDEGHEAYFEDVQRVLLDLKSDDDRSIIIEGARFMRMALAIYGHGMYMYNHAIGGSCSLTRNWLTCNSRVARGIVRGDNLCGCNTNAFLLESGIDTEDVLYASFSSGVAKRPYCVVADHKLHAIVIVVRGTFALEDAVTDISLRPVSLESLGVKYGFDGQSEYAHSGMCASAEWVAEDLKRLGILESLLMEGDSRYFGYSLRITGHSLGAGVAAILALMLHSSFPTLKCLVFEPPGCVLTERAAQQEYIFSFVHGCDIVPRLSVYALESFRDDVLEMIARSQVPKYQVLAPNPLDRTMPGKVTHRRTSIPESSFYEQLKEFWAYHRDRKSERGERSIPLVVPGKRIVHLIKTREKSRSSNFLISSTSSSPTLTTTAIWAKSEDFLAIQLASSLLSDHDPGILTQELESLASTLTR